MASARKKQDEKNLKILRELVSLPGNKHCFDCNQRGPTYINMTIGSFVCTKCSGMLRGLTPPYRVKSISMATFTPEEVELVKSRGNIYCQQTWLGLYDQKQTTETKDEQQIKDFMVDKYERKRFYLDPSSGLRNGTMSQPTIQNATLPEVKPLKSILTNSQARDLQIKNSFNNARTNGTAANSVGSDFVADFGSADIFSAAQFNNNGTNAQSQASFANFDNNPIFNASNTPQSTPFTQCPPSNSIPVAKAVLPPSEDRYAALKDLDNALKQQQEPVEWNNGCNGSGYASSPQSGSLYGSPNNAGSMYGSPSQGQFATAFQQQDITSNNTSNPFQPTPAVRNPWGPNGNSTVIANNFQGFGANPFRTDSFNGAPKLNGVSNGFNGNQISNIQPFQQNIFPSSQQVNFANSKPWNAPNPFTLGVTPGNGGHSNNPFL